jgi:hypothetical protein
MGSKLNYTLYKKMERIPTTADKTGTTAGLINPATGGISSVLQPLGENIGRPLGGGNE